jgi:hypothetical protein
MRFITHCFLLAMFGLAVLPSRGYSQCVSFDAPGELFARSEVVLQGTVVARQPTGAKGAHVVVDIATLRIEQSWKGNLEREVRVGSDRAFEIGKEYLVFAAGKPLFSSIQCRWAEPVEQAKTKIEWLSKRK